MRKCLQTLFTSGMSLGMYIGLFEKGYRGKAVVVALIMAMIAQWGWEELLHRK